MKNIIEGLHKLPERLKKLAAQNSLCYEKSLTLK